MDILHDRPPLPINELHTRITTLERQLTRALHPDTRLHIANELAELRVLERHGHYLPPVPTPLPALSPSPTPLPVGGVGGGPSSSHLS